MCHLHLLWRRVLPNMQTFKAFYTRPHNIQVVEPGQELKTFQVPIHPRHQSNLRTVLLPYRWNTTAHRIPIQ